MSDDWKLLTKQGGWTIFPGALRVFLRGFSNQAMLEQYLTNYRGLRREIDTNYWNTVPYVALGLTALQVLKNVLTIDQVPLEPLTKPPIPADAATDVDEGYTDHLRR